MKIFHFYHIYADGKWQNPVLEHIEALKASNLDKSLNKMFVGFVGNSENIFKVKQYLNDKIDYETVDEQPTGWEQVTLEHVHSCSKNNLSDVIFYAHTKGSSSNSHINTNWRKSMTYYNVIKWKECYDHLNYVDTVGCHLVGAKGPNGDSWGPNGIWGGNFWWATCKYLSNIGPIQYNSRYDAEGWVLSPNNRILYDMNPGFPSINLFKTNW